MERVLILGKGYIGQSIYKGLLSPLRVVDIVDRYTVDYHDIETMRDYLFKNKVTVVVNCSGFTGKPNVDEGEEKKEVCWLLNVTKPLEILHLCESLGIKYIHMSSGCIYDGYEREYSEKDTPNFGLFDYSSFYSKSKHAFETVSQGFNLKILRLRMPICPDVRNERNYLRKILAYRNLIDFKNSKTYIPDLCKVVERVIYDGDLSWEGQDIYNVVNSDPLTTKEIITRVEYHIGEKLNKNWVNIDELDIVAPRSNCILSNDKVSELYKMPSEMDILDKALTRDLDYLKRCAIMRL